MINIDAGILRAELEQILELIDGISESVNKGIPGVEIPSDDFNVEMFEIKLRGTLRLAAERLIALTEVIE